MLVFINYDISSVAQSCLTPCEPWTAARQASLSITSFQSLLKVSPSSRWCHLTISSSVVPFSSHLQSFPASGSFKWVSSSHQVDKVLEFQLQHQSFQWIFRTDFLSEGLVGSPSSPRVSQESLPTPQFKSINSSALSFLYSSTLTSIHDYWKDHSLPRQTFVGKVMSLLFNMVSRLIIAFLPRSKCLLI